MSVKFVMIDIQTFSRWMNAWRISLPSKSQGQSLGGNQEIFCVCPNNHSVRQWMYAIKLKSGAHFVFSSYVASKVPKDWGSTLFIQIIIGDKLLNKPTRILFVSLHLLENWLIHNYESPCISENVHENERYFNVSFQTNGILIHEEMYGIQLLNS